MEVTRAARPTNCCAAAFCSSAYILYTGTNFYEYFHTITNKSELVPVVASARAT